MRGWLDLGMLHFIQSVIVFIAILVSVATALYFALLYSFNQNEEMVPLNLSVGISEILVAG